MLIRSQNKMGLYDMKGAGIYVLGREIQMSKWSVTLGTYSTKEKAIEVLDKIQNNYKQCEIAKLGHTTYDKFSWTFQMPQDYEIG